MYSLQKLTYLYQDLEPYIDTHTVALHFNKHTKKYLNNLNQLLKDNDFDFSISLEHLAKNIYHYHFKKQEDIIFNLGGVLNHELYFQCMAKQKKEPDGFLRKDLIEKYGSIKDFIQEFIQTSLTLKGSGYTFLEVDQIGNLKVQNYINQDSPLFIQSIPLFTVDLWEHAYYLNVENEKERYLNNFFEIADFTYANILYEKLKMTNEVIH